MSKPSWAETFPRLFDLYSGSDPNNPKNYFEAKNIKKALANLALRLDDIESDLQEMDEVAWKEFKSKTIPYVTATDEWGWNTQLFDRFNEANGYVRLKEQGYTDIHFITEIPDKKTPDLCGRRDDGAVLLEVKTVHESDDAKDNMANAEKYRNERVAQKVQHYLNDKMKQKLESTIHEATKQLLFEYPDPGINVKRRIIFLAVRFDPNSATRRSGEELAQFLKQPRPENIEIVHHVENLFPLYDELPS